MNVPFTFFMRRESEILIKRDLDMIIVERIHKRLKVGKDSLCNNDEEDDDSVDITMKMKVFYDTGSFLLPHPIVYLSYKVDSSTNIT